MSDWHKATFPNEADAAQYHWEKHAKHLGKTLDEYTQEALAFYATHKGLSQSVILRDGSAGVLIRLGRNQAGGYFTPSGKIVSFWYS